MQEVTATFFAATEVKYGFWEIFFKILIPSMVAVSVTLAIKNRIEGKRLSIGLILSTAIIGIGVTYMCSGYILKYTSNEGTVFAASAVTYSAEKIGGYLIYRIKVDMILDAIIDGMKTLVLNLIKKK